MFDIQNNFFHSDNLSDVCRGYLDKRRKIKKEWPGEPPQTYVGDVFQGNIHRHGFYFVDGGDKIFYDGLFYANKLEGYAQVFYNDGSNFQGLFKDNLRFGPGILTYPNGEQDVGLWMGQQLLRLGGLNDENLVPRLAVTSSGQLKLLKFRYLVPVFQKREDIAYTILESLEASEEVLKKSYKLYNMEVDNKRNLFFNRKLFDKNFFIEEDCTIDIVSNDNDDDDDDDEDPTTEDTEKEEDAEETPGGKWNIHVERVREISEQLEVIENRLKIVTKQKVIMEKQVEYCRACCSRYQEQEEETVTRGRPESFQETEIPMNIFACKTVTLATNDAPTAEKEAWKKASEMSSSTTMNSTYSFSYGTSFRESINNLDDDMAAQTNDTSRIQSYLDNTCACDEMVNLRDLYDMEKELETVTRDFLFFESIMKNLKMKLERHLQHSQDKTTEVKTTKVLVKEVLAWNNEDYCMRMLRHSFLQRRSEYMVNFKVADLLAGNRSLFQNPGPHERSCVEFLKACSRGDLQTIFKLVGEDKINPNVCDAKGNNGIFFAAVNQHIETIKALVNLGTKLNQQNDEGLYPLSMCILVYIAEKYDVEVWEKSFLMDVEPMPKQKEAYKWYANTSLVNIPDKSQHKYNSKGHVIEEKSCYLFDLPYVIPTEEEIARFKEEELNFSKGKSKVMIQASSIKDSIRTLLNCGADPHVCEAPLPPLVLAVFAEDATLVQNILAADADVDITIKHDMTCLHIVASQTCNQSSVDICSLLLAYNLDPKLRTSTDHWPEQKTYILGNNVSPEDVEDAGKNALHILCMRQDFSIDNCSYFDQMTGLFSNSDIDFNDKYLGHTPLSLAVLVGNRKLVMAIMRLFFIDPYETLGNDMGNVLTVYILKRYEDVIPPNAKDILKSLVDLGVNPLKPIGEVDNAIEFMEKEHQVVKDKRKKSVVDRKTADKSGVSQKVLKEYLKDLARDTIIKYVQMQAVERLYNLMEDGLIEHECVSMLKEFLTPFVVLSNLQHLFKHGKIQLERYDKSVCLKILDIVNEYQKEEKAKKETKKSNTKTKGKKDVPKETDQDHTSIDSYEYGIILDMTDFRRAKRAETNWKMLPPGVDNISKYKVCFHCLKKKNKTLVVCPRCQMIYFCSEACNKANLKLRTMHACNDDFYERMQSPEALAGQVNLSKLYGRARENCEKRLLKKQEEEQEKERLKLQEELKNDPYGLKALKKFRRPKKYLKTPTLTTLLSSLDDVMGFELDGDVNQNPSTESLAYTKILTSARSDDILRKDLLEKASDEEYKCLMAKKQLSSLTKLPTVRPGKKTPCGKKTCECDVCVLQGKRADKIKHKCALESKEKVIREKIGAKKGVDILTEANITVKKLRQVPSRYQEFIELLTRYFPEVDFSALFLPYACYSNGHLYYKFLDHDFYTKTYSMM